MNDILHSADDELFFQDELDENDASLLKAPRPTWRVLIVDDDRDVHNATTFALGNVEIQHRTLSFLHAYSAAEARQILSVESDIAVILLDVVMEHQDAGLQLVSYIRSSLKLTDARIILRTGQPGYAPEIDAIRDYDINDYKTKSELTRTKLYTSVTCAIRSYEQICAVSASQVGLELIVNASNELITRHGLQDFSTGVLEKIAELLGESVDGLVCTKNVPSHADELNIVAVTPNLTSLLNQSARDVLPVASMDLLQRALAQKRNLYEGNATVLFFDNVAPNDVTIFLRTKARLSELNRRLLDVFYSNLSVGLHNAILTSRLHSYAFYDPLTGLANRLRLLQSLNETLASPTKDDAVLSLVDIDHFAETNDALGHQFGDALLSAIAHRLVQYFGKECQIARVGSDAFALLGTEKMVNPTALQAIFHKPFQVQQQATQISATIGLVKLSECEGDASEAFKDTNIALKRAKMHHRASYAYFTRDMGVDIRERVSMMHALRNAFERKHLFVVYQPQIDMRNGRVVGAEALIRWRTEKGEMISPERFIPIAEYSGLISEIGDWVLRSACAQQTHLRSLGHVDFQMAINVSQAQFSHPNFMQSLQSALEDTGATPQNVELEITESMAMKDPELLINTLHQIKLLGMMVSIDDFGTGFSSLNHLQKLDVDKLKIDRSFVNEIQENSGDGNIAKMIIQLGQSLGLDIIAEGVETTLQANTLLSFGCRLAQGFLYAKPMTVEDLHVWLKQQ